jgi:hypothetical protein
MIINFQAEAAKRRARAGKAQATHADRLPGMNAPSLAAPMAADCGSGWYHSAAIKREIQSHRDWD